MILKNALIYTGADGRIAFGDIHNDTRGKFPDGAWIRTSLISKIWKDAETGKNYIQTKNSTYEIEYHKDAEIPEEHA